MSLYFQGWGTHFLGWGAGSVPVGPTFFLTGGDDAPPRKRDDVAADIRQAIAQLNRVINAAETIAETQAVPVPRFEPIHTRLMEALQTAMALVQAAETRIERTRLQVSIAKAQDARKQLEAREAATKAIAKARLKRAAAFLTIILGDD